MTVLDQGHKKELPSVDLELEGHEQSLAEILVSESLASWRCQKVRVKKDNSISSLSKGQEVPRSRVDVRGDLQQAIKVPDSLVSPSDWADIPSEVDVKVVLVDSPDQVWVRLGEDEVSWRQFNQQLQK